MRSPIVKSLVLAFLCCALTCRGEDSSFGVTLFSPRQTYRSFGEFEMKLRMDDLRAKGAPVKTAEIEIRDSARKLRILRFPYVWNLHQVDDHRRVRLENASSDSLGEAVLRRLAGVPPGEYDVALLINGVKASNVMRVQIDPAHDASSNPTVSFGVIEAASGANDARLIVRVHVPQDKELTVGQLIASPLLVDGIERKPGITAWIGPVPNLKPGDHWYFIPDLNHYEPAIEPKGKHRIQLQGYPADIEFDFAQSELGTLWDRTSSELKERPLPAALLSGTVTDSGVGAEAYEVFLLSDKGERFTEFTDEKKGFQFFGVPPGKYRVGCGVLNGASYGYTAAQPETVEIKDGEAASITVRFRTWKTKSNRFHASTR